jgi:FkbM family methyltransferase
MDLARNIGCAGKDSVEQWFEHLLVAAAGSEMRSCTADSNTPVLAGLLSSLKSKAVLIYGAGSFGREVYKLVSGYGIKVLAFLDQKGSAGRTLLGLPVYRADDMTLGHDIKEGTTVLFSIVMDRDSRLEVMAFIRRQGFRDIIEAQSIRCLQVQPDDCGDSDAGKEYLVSRRSVILKAAALWGDDESVRTYMCNVAAHVSRTYNGCREHRLSEQYFPGDINLYGGYCRFIDCGAYIGDTLEALVSRNIKVEAAALIEPAEANFRELAKTADRLKAKVRQMIIFPCAVSDTTGMSPFAGDGGSGTLHEQGESMVMTVALDDILKGFRPTFIKMDVEGAEIRALQGAEKMIRESRPDLAICVYHCINHLWDVPHLIAGWDLGYRFYLRSYNACTMETVLYATCSLLDEVKT